MPSNLQAFLVLLFFIAPGFLFLQAYQYGRARYYREPNLFRQTLSTLIASTVIHTLLLLFLGVVTLAYLAISRASFTVSYLLKPLPNYPANELVSYFIVLASYSAFSLLAGWWSGLRWQRVMTSEVPGRFDRTLGKVFGLGKEEAPLWWVLIGQMYAKGIEPQLQVHLRNGDECIGTVDDLRWIGDRDLMFELILRDVSYMMTQKTDTLVLEERKLLNQRLLLLSSDILWLSRIDLPQRKVFI